MGLMRPHEWEHGQGKNNAAEHQETETGIVIACGPYEHPHNEGRGRTHEIAEAGIKPKAERRDLAWDDLHPYGEKRRGRPAPETCAKGEAPGSQGCTLRE